jgi:hypothetical protein
MNFRSRSDRHRFAEGRKSPVPQIKVLSADPQLVAAQNPDAPGAG